MKIAVLMSTYNGEKYIREQIDSILQQEGDFGLDLWVRDDGSCDRTQEILEEYSSEGQLHWYTGDNLGPAFSFYDLIKKCVGYDFYAFADQDDYWKPDKVSTGVNMLQNYYEPAIYFANAELVDSELKSLGRNVYRNAPEVDLYTVMCAANVLGCTMLFNQQMAEVIRSKRIPDKMTMHDSYLARVCAAIDGCIVYDETAHMQYRQHGNNVVGMSVNMTSIIRSRIRDIGTKAKISIAEQAEVIIALYSDMISEENMKCLKRVSAYKTTIWKRIALACSRKTRYSSKNMAFKFRMSILLGNR